MNEKVADTLDRARPLNAEERVYLIDALIDGGSHEPNGGYATPAIQKAWAAEVERRIARLRPWRSNAG